MSEEKILYACGVLDTTRLLLNSPAVAVFGKTSSGWFWQLSFDFNKHTYTLENNEYFPDPIEANKHLDDFCENNGVKLLKKEWD